MDDLEIAKRLLSEEGFSLAIVKSGKAIYTANNHGVKSFLDAIEKHGDELAGSTVADRVVGVAVAMLCKYSKIKKVYGGVMSIKALEKLLESGIITQYGMLVPEILDSSRIKTCPLERIAASCKDEVEFYEKCFYFSRSRKTWSRLFF
ncbi:MAG: DUF1893 domain-containing protein [Thermoproteota archaeon]